MRKNSIVSKSKQTQSQTTHPNTSLIRPKRCHNCQKMFAVDKYDEHVQSCYRFRQSQKINNNNNNNNQIRSNSIVDNPSIVSHATTMSTTKSRIFHGNNSIGKTQKGQNNVNVNANKNRLVVNNNVVIPGKASSNITRKGPHKNIGNTNSIAQRKFKKNQNPQEHQKIEKPKVQQPTQMIKEQQKIEEVNSQNRHNIEISQKKQQNYQTQVRPSSRNIRINSRPGSANRNIPMPVRVAEQSARLADFYNGSTNRPRIQPFIYHAEQQQINTRIGQQQQRKMSMSSQSGYQSSQLANDQGINNQRVQQYPEENNMNFQKKRDKEVQRNRQRERQRREQTQKLERQRQRQLERERLRQHYRVARQLERQRQRQRQLQRERQQRQQRLQRERQRERQLQRQREREQQRQRQRQRERERQRQRQRQRQAQQGQQTQQPRVNIELLVQTTNQIIDFVQELSINDEGLTDMLNQLRQLNAISTQIRQLNNLGQNLGFRMGVVFAQRIQQLQNVIMNQIGIVLIRSFHNNITEDFQRLLSLRPTQPIVTYAHFKKQQIQSTFPLKYARELDECSICLQQIVPKQHIRQLQCKHVFHPDCINGWLLQSRKCPMCRHEQRVQ